MPELIDKARAADTEGCIRFEVQNATRLTYADAAFDQIIYLQQLLCFIDDDVARARAVQEAFRVLRPGGIALFSVLSFEVRRSSPVYRSLIMYWRLLRWLRRSSLSVQSMPWMRLGDRFNPAALLDRDPHVYGFRTDEIVSLLENAGFSIQAVGSSRQIRLERLCANLGQLAEQQLEGAIYCVLRKPEPGSGGPAPDERGAKRA